MRFELRAVALSEDRVLLWFVLEPGAEPRRWCNLLHPLGGMETLLPQPPRPEPIDKVSFPIGHGERLVDSLRLDSHPAAFRIVGLMSRSL